jgi:hypothetical protein
VTTQLSPAVAGQLAEGLAGICATTGLPAHRAQLIKYTMNAVYRVGDRVVIRLSRGPEARVRATRLVGVVAALQQAGAPIVSLVDDIEQPVVVGDWIATVWSHVATSEVSPRPVDLGEPLRRFHAIEELRALELPGWRPVDKALRRVNDVLAQSSTHLAASEAWSLAELGCDLAWLASWLHERASDLQARLDATSWGLPAGVIHGDAHTGNVLLPVRSAGSVSEALGEALLCDLDSVCLGPREWDLTPTAHGAFRFGRSLTDYHDFVRRYGVDVTEVDAWPVLRDVRDLQLVTSVLPSLAGRPDVAAQLGVRLRSLLAGDTAAIWTRYT